MTAQPRTRKIGAPTTFVLVHGAWFGGWCWTRVSRMLRDVGHDVYTPSLTGLGDRAHLYRPDVDLATHVQDVVALLEAEELRQVVLVGHSYGGMVITGVAARAAARLTHLVYLDAFVPSRGQSLLDLVDPERAETMRATFREQGEGWRVPVPTAERMGVTSAKDSEWLVKHLVPQPYHTFDQPSDADVPSRLKRTYIYCAQSTGSFERYRDLEENRAWQYQVLKTGHGAMITAAREVATILLGQA